MSLKDSKLKPCPFCGEELEYGFYHYSDDLAWEHENNGCYLAGGIIANMRDVILWNQRAGDEDE